jgi:hypothetical protein
MKEINERTIKSASKVMLNSADMDMDVYLHIVELVIEDEKHNNHVTTFNENDVHFRQWENDLKKSLDHIGKESKTNGVDEIMPVTCMKDTIKYTDTVPRETYLTKEE